MSSQGGRHATHVLFSFEWGYEADLVIKETTISNPPADGSSLRRELVKVGDRRTTVGSTFRLQLAPFVTSAESLSQILSGSCDTGYTLFPSFVPKALVFDAGLSCESFAAALASDVPSALELRFGEPNEGLLVLSLIP